MQGDTPAEVRLDAELGPVRYVLCPGYVMSQRDGDEHFIGAVQLARLYGVPLNECATAPDHRTPESVQASFWRRHANLPKLVPRYSGDYTIPKA
jgi:hypothetical protein